MGNGGGPIVKPPLISPHFFPTSPCFQKLWNLFQWIPHPRTTLPCDSYDFQTIFGWLPDPSPPLKPHSWTCDRTDHLSSSFGLAISHACYSSFYLGFPVRFSCPSLYVSSPFPLYYFPASISLFPPTFTCFSLSLCQVCFPNHLFPLPPLSISGLYP